MLIDCETCRAPESACRDCVITFLLDRPALPVEFDPAEEVALGRLADAGLLPPLRLVPEVVLRPEGSSTGDSSRIGREIA